MPLPPLYAACVPVLLRYLAGLRRTVAAVAALPADEAARVTAARLAPDMLAFDAQVDTAVHFARRIAFPLAGLPVPPFRSARHDLVAMLQLVDEAGDELRALPPSSFADAGHRRIAEQAGSAAVDLPAETFLHEFAIPNFLFHVGMAYAIARAQGVALGKGSYDGFHVYPGGDAAAAAAR